ncbi:MAG: tetratricopeptide repeat protein [Campylobacteraceae bacterium]
MKNKYIILPLFLVATSLFSQEPSAFDAGNINIQNPYGLTQNEKELLDIKNRVSALNKEVGSIKIQSNSASEQVEGVRSVFDSLGLKISNIEQSVNELKFSNSESNATLDGLHKEINELKVYVEESRDIQAKNQESVKQVLTKLTTLVDNMNKNYIPRKEYAELEKRVLALESKKVAAAAASTLSSMNGVDLQTIGEEFFAKKEYKEAKPYFEEMLAKNYKPARSNFVLGEIAYFAGEYSNAITYYKKSAELFDKAEWMPKLMYHTAISFDKISDTANANQFYNALKSSYPESEEAKAAPNRK